MATTPPTDPGQPTPGIPTDVPIDIPVPEPTDPPMPAPTDPV